MSKLFRMTLLTTVSAMLFTACSGKQENSGVPAITDITINTTVTPGGQFPDNIVVTFESNLNEKVSAEDFTMNGKAMNWLDTSLHSFTASFSDVKVEGNTMTLYFDGFTDKFFFVKSWSVTNSKNDSLSFNSEMPNKVITPVADEFEAFDTENGAEFDHYLYTPKNADKPLPLIVVFHGFGDTCNILTYRTSVAWAEEEAQAKNPCYILSPTIYEGPYYDATGRSNVFDIVYKEINSMIDSGKVDPSRVYIMGNSFGGMSTIEFMEKYPDVAAAAMALCPALNYSQTAMASLDKIPNTIPIYIAQAENDGTIPSENSKNLYAKLKELGNESVQLRIYSDDEMNAAGGSSDPDSTFSYHHVEMAVMEDPSYAEWLFAQHK